MQSRPSTSGGKNPKADEKTLSTGLAYSNRWFLPLAVVVVMVPLITFVHKYTPDLDWFAWFSGIWDYDAFLFYKGVALEIAAGIMLFLMGYSLLIRKHRKTGKRKTKSRSSSHKNKGALDSGVRKIAIRDIVPVMIAGLFALMCLLSTIFSEHPSDALWGGYARFEGCFVLLSYVTCFYMAFGYVKTLETIRFLLDALLVGAFFIGLLGTLQAAGLDWYQSGWGQKLMSLPEFAGKQLEFTSFAAPHTVYATLFNPNYIGSYVPLVLPVCLYMIIWGERIWRRILAAVTSILLIITLIWSHSDAGLVAVAVGILVASILLFPALKKKVKIMLILAGGIFIGGVGYILVSGGFISNLFSADEARIIENISTSDNEIHIQTYDGKRLTIVLDKAMLMDPGWSSQVMNPGGISIVDDQTGAALSTDVNENNQLALEEPGYPALLFYASIGTVPAELSETGYEYTYDSFHINDSLNDWEFTTENGTLKYRNLIGELCDLRNVDRTGFEGHYGFASGRGYIYASTIPLLPNYLITGAGPDNFIYVFPNDDYVGRRNWGYGGIVVAKPLNMFLQIWVQDGLIALIAFLALYGIFMVRVTKMCYRKRKSLEKDDNERTKGITTQGVAIATAIGTSAYMVAGLANDSIVCVAPVYWVMLGVGYAAERMWRRELSAAGDGVKPETASK